MAVIKKISLEIEPNIPEVIAVISLVMSMHKGKEVEFLEAIKDATTRKLNELKESEQNGKRS